MCRLFAQFSATPSSARPLLVDAKFSLLKQSDIDPGNVQKEGWGVGWIDKRSRAVVVKSPRAAFQDAKRFAAAADRAVSTGAVGHIRAASNPLGLPRSRLLTVASAQPYSNGEWLFVHNGTLEIPLAVAAKLGPLRRRIQSKNDSEVYFWQFHKFLERTGDPALAFQACVRENWAVWRTLPESSRGGKAAPYTSINAIVTDGRRLYAFCHSARLGLAKCGLCHPTQSWQTMCFSERAGSLIVASEGLDSGRWTLFDPPELLKAEFVDGRLRLERTRYELVEGELIKKGAAKQAALL